MGTNPGRVAQVVEKALWSSKPKAIYKVGVSKQLSTVTSLTEEKVDDPMISMLRRDEK